MCLLSIVNITTKGMNEMKDEPRLQIDLDGDGELEVNVAWRLVAKLGMVLSAVTSTLLGIFHR